MKKNSRKIWWKEKKSLPLHPQLRHCNEVRTMFPLRALKGEMVEWSITTVLKTVVLRGTGGSNPSLSAINIDFQ